MGADGGAREIKAIEDAMERNELGYLERRYGGFEEAMQRAVANRERTRSEANGRSLD